MKISLDGDGRLLSKEHGIDVPIQVPGSVFEALIDAGKLEDPFYGLNEHESSWVYEADWTITREFAISADMLEKKRVFLKFYGIDTFGTVFLNGQEIGCVDNMHREWELDVGGILKESGNLLEVKLDSPTRIARDRRKAQGAKIPATPDSLEGGPYTHKAQYSYGWDWGPKLPDIGVWRRIELIGMDDYRLLHYQAIPRFSDDYAEVDLEIHVEAEVPKAFSEKLTNKVILSYFSPQEIDFTKEIESGNNTVTLTFEPELWWIKELGIPNLYKITVQLLFDGIVVDEMSGKIGLRDIKLMRREDEWGESFFFELNGTPVFAKGANWIPHHSFIPKGTRLGLYRSTIEDAIAANMNMLRIWGGGIMEDDLFYDACDELGMLVWQDFPFACKTIPFVRDENGTHNKYYENAKVLAIQNIIRLRNRSSLAMWCGNNEIESIVFSNKRLSKDSEELKSAYVEVFEDLYPALCKELDPTRSYWPSSPSCGGLSSSRKDFDTQDESIGDAHFWMVWHGGAPFSAYRKNFSRFMSEFGFESFPEIKTCLEFCPRDQFDFESPIMRNHQKNFAGNQKIMDYMKKRFKIPDDFEKQVILSQLTQAEAIEYGVEHWRRQRGSPGKERCMGALYWQLNDCWPVASWSSIDYSKKLAEHHGIPGRWKALHYFAKRFYKPVIASIAEGKKDTEIWGVNALKETKEATLEWSIVDMEAKVLREGSRQVSLPPCSSKLIETIDLREIFGHHVKKLVGRFDVVDDEYLHYLDEDSYVSAPPPEAWPKVDDSFKDFIGQDVVLAIYPKDSKQPGEEEGDVIFGQSDVIQGKCVLDGEGNLCLKKQLISTNPALYDIPLAEMVEPYSGKLDMVLEMEGFKNDPGLIVICRFIVGDEVVSESSRPFSPPGDLPLVDPCLSWDIKSGEGKEWEIEISSEALALYVYLGSDELDFWCDDNFFLMEKGKKTIHVRFLDVVTSEEVKQKIVIKSLYDLIH
ncbi:MAG: glycoside hydrolase family 2 protein [Candidatus Hodarchaeota archaeon]